MGKLDDIKARQAAYRAAIDAGEEPAVAPATKSAGTMRGNKLALIKQRQIDAGADAPAMVAAAKPGLGVAIPPLAMQQSALVIDIAKIKEVKTLDEKRRIKRVVLPQYLPWVAHYVESAGEIPNSVAVQVMIWQFDVGEIEDAMQLALHLIAQGIHQLPARFERRDLETFVCDAMYDWANDLLKNTEHGASPYLDDLVAALRDGKWQLHPAVESKTYVMLAKHKVRGGDDDIALQLCEWAEAANPDGAGVKTLKGQIQSRIKSRSTNTNTNTE